MRTKVLVIGGGPGGSTAARVLAESGVDTVLVEKDFSFVKPCGGGIPSGAFDELGIPRSLIRNKVRRLKLVSPSERSVEVDLDGGFIGIVERGQFDAALRDKARASGAELLEARFSKFLEVGNRVVSEVFIQGRPCSITSDYVVVADGVNSRTMALTGMSPPSTVHTLTTRVQASPAECCEFWFGSSHAPGFYSWVFPYHEGVSVGTGGFNGARLTDLLHNFLARRKLPREGPLRGYRIPLWDTPVFNKGRLLFAGDAAGQVMPLTFEGIYYSMKAGQFAAEALIHDRPSEYGMLWRKRFHKRFAFMRRLWDHFFRDDASMEKLVSLCRRTSVQKASMRLWLDKSLQRGCLTSYVNIFRKFLS